mmetsp:Transcript_2504/g.9915  ORF Transcript_2504/g.9915 Transcript_2504/m.9915 type:complete len:230 (-) Transcript_2504:1482-2171(-)
MRPPAERARASLADKGPRFPVYGPDVRVAVGQRRERLATLFAAPAMVSGVTATHVPVEVGPARNLTKAKRAGHPSGGDHAVSVLPVGDERGHVREGVVANGRATVVSARADCTRRCQLLARELGCRDGRRRPQLGLAANAPAAERAARVEVELARARAPWASRRGVIVPVVRGCVVGHSMRGPSGKAARPAAVLRRSWPAVGARVRGKLVGVGPWGVGVVRGIGEAVGL